ncbi:hypothetical protein AWU65_04940 [Paenibacillus glucanolyticus]|uniref:Uncharacterized protein n=1 Tax=Paenibacillus glucanolyticus TaxID=59843 RepID=A0A163H527_9BACL|nr:hypothetical protein AWU65_04940 [Paenibacillus glucanolyticus]
MSLKKRTKRINIDKSYSQLTFKQALDMAISEKKAEGLRDRTIKDYEKHYGYFVKWLHDYMNILSIKKNNLLVFIDTFYIHISLYKGN